jgi:hypothetical protein
MSYLVFIGMAMAVLSEDEDATISQAVKIGIFAPILLPIVLGYELQKKLF